MGEETAPLTKAQKKRAAKKRASEKRNAVEETAAAGEGTWTLFADRLSPASVAVCGVVAALNIEKWQQDGSDSSPPVVVAWQEMTYSEERQRPEWAPRHSQPQRP